LLLAASLLQAGPCAIDSLANYETLPPSGCTVGGLQFSGFGFTVGPNGGGAVVIGAGAITVTPLTGAESGLSFTSGGFNVVNTGFVSYIITYTEDPSGDIRSMDDVLDDPVTAPGVGRIDSLGCLGASFSPTCPTSTVSVSVFDDGIAPQLTKSVNFAGVHILGVQDTISLDGHGTGSVSMNGFGGSSFIPEPSTMWLGLPVAGLVFARRARLKLAQIRFQHRA
jgi:hypothetical protein